MRRFRPKRFFQLTLYIFYLGVRSVGMIILFGGESGSLIVGLACIGISLVLFLTIGGVKGEMQAPFEDSEKYRKCFMGTAYNLEASLSREIENKKLYKQEQMETKQTALEGVAIFLLGLLINLLSRGFDALISSSFLPVLPIGHIAGCYVEFFALCWIFRAYVNSSLPYAKEISETFMLRTTSVKIEECSKMIAVIQNRLREQDEKWNAIEREYEKG